jgi:predicted nucleotidyltransferase
MDPTSSIAAMRQSLTAVGTEMAALDLIVLFGSAASGGARANSDVDVAVLGQDVVDLDLVFVSLAPKLKTHRLDLVDLRRAGPLLAFEVARSGVVLFERTPTIFRQFQSLASRRYADTKKLRDAQRRSLHVFLAREHHT